jgi:hypothetical protein
MPLVLVDLIFGSLKYFDHVGREHIIAGVYFSAATHAALPRILPELLPPPPPPYVIRDTLTRGKALFSTRAIATGEIIIVERPIAVAPEGIIVDICPHENMDVVSRMISRLTSEDSMQYFNLHNCMGDTLPLVQGIFQTNARPVPLRANNVDFEGIIPRYGGIFLAISRINHRCVYQMYQVRTFSYHKMISSCVPNTAFYFNHYTFCAFVKASRPIAAGEEITLSYCSHRSLPRADRIAELKEKYNFVCDCSACKSPPTSESARNMITSWVRTGLTFERWIQNSHLSSEEFIAEAHRMLALIETHGPAEFAFRHYLGLCMCYGALGDTDEMKKWGFMALLQAAPVDESYYKAYNQLIDWLINPRSFPLWGKGTFRKKAVGKNNEPV